MARRSKPKSAIEKLRASTGTKLRNLVTKQQSLKRDFDEQNEDLQKKIDELKELRAAIGED